MSRVLVPLLVSVVWTFYYLNARCAYALPKSPKKTLLQLFFVFGSFGIFGLQIKLMERLSPGDAYGTYFFLLILFEFGGATAILIATLIRERAKSIKMK